VNRRILVLDDEPGVLDAYRLILEPQAPSRTIRSSRGGGAAAPAPTPTPQAAPFVPTYVSSGEEALATIEQSLREGRPFVGGFVDVKLGPGMDGIEVVRRAQEMDPNFLSVIVTAYQDRSVDEISRIFGEEHADRWDFLTKPFSHSEILQKARNLVSNWDRRRREKEYLKQIKLQAQQLIRTERLAAVGTLARGIGHELGNILMRIIGRAEVAAKKTALDDIRGDLTIIASAAERAGIIGRNLQSMVRMETKRETMDVRLALRDALELVEHELRRAQVTLQEDYQDQLPRLSVNRIEMGQVFLNLIINAMHAMEPNGGTLGIRIFAHDGGITVEFRDSGCGIPEEHMRRIFEPLFTTKGEKGSGIGLSVSRKIIRNHGGQLTAVSRPGTGSVFTVWLPGSTTEAHPT